MKHIPRNSIVGISADYEDGNFPAANLLDNRPGRKWSAGGVVRNATLTIEVAGGLTDTVLFSTNAREASATAEDPCAVTFGDGDVLEGGDTLKNTTISTTATIYVDETGSALRVNFSPAVSVPCVVALNITSPGSETLYAGVAVAGIAETYGGANFRYGAVSTPNDYSITAQNSAGARYYKKRTIGKQYSLTALMLRTEADKLEATIRRDGAISSAWALFDNSTEMIFGWPQLQRSHDHRLHDNITLTITEEI